MKERPILMSTPMVRAILEGRKTQTRRIVKCQFVEKTDPGVAPYWRILDHPNKHDGGGTPIGPHVIGMCPYGQPGDRLWVRETFSAMGDKTQHAYPVFYKADRPSDTGGWTPSIHMPRWASRILLEVTNIRVERLNDISADDAMAEGMAWDDSVYDYSRLWEKLNGAGSWAANPWVWVVEFKRVNQ